MENDQQEQKKKEEEQSAAEAYRESGNLQFKKGDFREAVKLYTESIKRKATAAAYANRAQAYISLECYDDAIRDAESALNMDPAHLKARFRLGRAFFCKKMFDKAVDHYEKCLEQEPKNVQVRQAVEQCKQAMGIPKFQLSILHMGLVPQLSLTYPNGTTQQFDGPHQLHAALTSTKPVGPIAQIRLIQQQLEGDLFRFFQSLNPKMLEGGALEIQGTLDMESKQNFRRYIQLLKPASINIAKFSDALLDFTPHMRILDPTTKLLVLYPQFYCGSMDSKMQVNWNDPPRMRFVYLSIQSALAWLHAPPPMGKLSRCWNPPKPAPVERKEDVHLGSTTDQKLGQCQELTNLWRHPAAKILCIGEGNLFDQKQKKSNAKAATSSIDVDMLIDECHKLFREAKSRLNYSLKVMCQRGSNNLYSENGTKWKSPETLKPRAFANNTLGEQLRVSIQRLTLDNPHTRALMPPHYLVIIERFHT